MKTVHSMMSRNVPKAICYNRTELNAPLPPLVAHVATPDMGHTKNPCAIEDRPTSLPTDETPEDK